MCVRAIAAAVIAATVLACSAPPDKERHQAEGALAAARAAGAAVYAPDELAAAERALAQYDTAVGARDYRLALSLALEARDGAYEAARRAADEQASARAGAERLMAEAEQLLAVADARLSATPAARAQTSTASRWRTLRDTLTATLQEARTLVAEQDFRQARAELAPVVADLRAALAPVADGREP